jgi:hypothetical protein
MAEVLVVHASTPERIRKFNEAVSQLQIPFEGRIRKGYAPVFPYKVESWIYKTKEECVPELLKFIKSNTSGAEMAGVRPLQGVTLTAGRILKFISWIRHQYEKFHCTFIKRRRELIGRNVLDIPDMSKINPSEPSVEGWGHSAVICVINDNKNKRGQEEL